MSTTNNPTVRAYTLKELSALYGISIKAFKTWLEPHEEVIGKKKGWYFTALQVKMIFEKIGIPE
jgi:hypothetical protein